MIATYALTAGLIALVIGVPLGVLGGRIGWNRLADYLRVVPDAQLTPGVVAVVAIVVVSGALLTAIGPGAKAARVRPADVFNTDPT